MRSTIALIIALFITTINPAAADGNGKFNKLYADAIILSIRQYGNKGIFTECSDVYDECATSFKTSRDGCNYYYSLRRQFKINFNQYVITKVCGIYTLIINLDTEITECKQFIRNENDSGGYHKVITECPIKF